MAGPSGQSILLLTDDIEQVGAELCPQRYPDFCVGLRGVEGKIGHLFVRDCNALQIEVHLPG